jgi:hypothetical protein
VLYSPDITPTVEIFHKKVRVAAMYVTKDWALVLVDPANTDNFIVVNSDHWIPEFGDLYKEYQEE